MTNLDNLKNLYTTFLNSNDFYKVEFYDYCFSSIDYYYYLKEFTNNNSFSFVIPEFFFIFTILWLFILSVLNPKNFKEFYELFIYISLSIFITFWLFVHAPLGGNYPALSFFNQLFADEIFLHFAKAFILVLFLIFCGFLHTVWNFWLHYEYFFFWGLLLFFNLFLLSSWNFFTLIFTLEGISFLLYILLAFKSTNKFVLEAVIKYFILSSIASGSIFFGISYFYGLTESLDFNFLQQCFINLNLNYLVNDFSPILIIALLLILFGFFFKLTIVPFHNWAVDVYYGISFINFIFLVTIFKASMIILLVKILVKPLLGFSFIWKNLLLIFGLMSVLYGGIAAFTEKNFRRFLIYTSINNIGFILIALSMNNLIGFSSALFYGFVYISTMFIFFIILMNIFVQYPSIRIVYLSDLKQISKLDSFAGLALALLLLSMAGIPPLAGFFIKYKLFIVLVSNSLYHVLLIIVLVSLMTAYYYLKLIKILFFENLTNFKFNWFLNIEKNNNLKKKDEDFLMPGWLILLLIIYFFSTFFVFYEQLFYLFYSLTFSACFDLDTRWFF